MAFISAAYTDAGTTRKVNQDAFTLKTATVGNSDVALAVLCDGMGGMASGEIASSFVVNAFSAWFKNVFPAMWEKGITFPALQKSWANLIQTQNKKILEYGTKNGRMGTTLSAVMIIGTAFMTVQVGDSRIYKLDQKIQQISRDQSYVAKEMELGRMTAAEAKAHPRSHEVLQAVGPMEKIKPAFATGRLQPGEALLLCSDGFYHEISSDEIYGVLAPGVLTSEYEVESCLRGVTELVKSRGETDNISSMLIKKV